VKTKNKKIILILIILLAAFARLWQIKSMPGGLFPDQAANGEDALAILRGDIQPFYERGNGRESLFFVIQAVLIKFFGIGVWPMFLASAIVGTATVLVTWAAARRMFGERVALFSAFFIAANQWHISLSRTGFRAITAPLFIALTFYFFTGVFQKKKPTAKAIQAILAGISFSLGWYTYLAYRAFLGVIVVVAVSLLLQSLMRKPRFSGFKKYIFPTIFGIFAAGLTILPLVSYFIGHPGSFAGRTGQVSILNPDLNNGNVVTTATDILAKSLLAFFFSGDLNPRHNVSGFPFLSPLPAFCLFLGFLVSLLRSGQYASRLFRGKRTGNLLAFFSIIVLSFVMLVPAIASAEGIPHGLRSIGEIPVVFWFAGVGAAWLSYRVQGLGLLRVRRMTQGIALFLLIATAAYELFLYFGVSANSAKYWREYRTDLTEVSQYLIDRAKNNQGRSYLSLDDFSVQTVHYLTSNYGYPYELVKPEESEKVSLRHGDVIIFTQSTLPDAERYIQKHPESVEKLRTKNRFGETTMIVLELDPNIVYGTNEE